MLGSKERTVSQPCRGALSVLTIVLASLILSSAARSGNPVGSQFQINTYTSGTQWSPAVSVDAAGNFSRKAATMDRPDVEVRDLHNPKSIEVCGPAIEVDFDSPRGWKPKPAMQAPSRCQQCRDHCRASSVL